MRILSPGLAAHLGGGVTTLARCWALTRGDGLVQGFTDHDRDLTFDGITFSANTGLEAAEVTSELGFATGGGDVSGALVSAGLSEDDLNAGRYDGAQVSSWLVNWADVSQRVVLDAGTLGEVRRSDGRFVAEMRGLAHAFDQERGRVYTTRCTADLGDARCGVVATPGLAVATASDGRLGLSAPTLAPYPDGWFTGGKLTFTSGANTGFSTEVKLHRKVGAAVDFSLWQAAPKLIVAGDGFQVTPGCDKRFATCKGKFGNGPNFRGFPHMPGNDFVLAGVRQGDAKLDGGSLFT
jgi:uncharacterized phage protein (TIGR02218 family)